MAFVTPAFCYEIGHLATKFLPSEVGVLKFRTTDVCSKDREQHRNEGFLHVSRDLCEQDFDTFCPFTELRHGGCSRFTDIVFHCNSAF